MRIGYEVYFRLNYAIFVFCLFLTFTNKKHLSFFRPFDWFCSLNESAVCRRHCKTVYVKRNDSVCVIIGEQNEIQNKK